VIDLIQPITTFLSQNHSPCEYRHHFTGDFINTCDKETINNTLHCAHKESIYGPTQLESLFERLADFNIINEKQKKLLKEFTFQILDNNIRTDVAAFLASLHLRGRGEINPFNLNVLGLKSSAELEAMDLPQLKKLAAEKQIQANKGLVALKFTIWNVNKDYQRSDYDSAKERMQRFIARWIPSQDRI
jgi:hypothetical protein